VSVVAINSYRLTIGNNFNGIPAYWDVSPIRLFGVPISVDRAMVLVIAIVTQVGWVDVLPTVFIILILLFKPSGLFGSAVKGVWEQ
jgi:hypothetical protein